MTTPRVSVPPPRVALTPPEAAGAIGVGLTTFREQIQPDLKVVRRGRVVLIGIAELERFMVENAEPVLSNGSADRGRAEA